VAGPFEQGNELLYSTTDEKFHGKPSAFQLERDSMVCSYAPVMV
jgi:hypothetical protein